MTGDDTRTENATYIEPCKEFVELRRLLDKADIPWHDASEHIVGNCYSHHIHRTHGDGFSVIYGNGSYGCEVGLLEVRISSVLGVTGYITAKQAFEMIKEHYYREDAILESDKLIEELKLCPFCESEARMRRVDFPDGDVEWVVDCSCGRKIFEVANKKKTIEAWNTRATLGSGTCENKAKSWGEFECSECGFYADFGSDLHRVRFCPDCGKVVNE